MKKVYFIVPFNILIAVLLVAGVFKFVFPGLGLTAFQIIYLTMTLLIVSNSPPTITLGALEKTNMAVNRRNFADLGLLVIVVAACIPALRGWVV